MANLITQTIGEMKGAGSSTPAGGNGNGESAPASTESQDDSPYAEVELVGDEGVVHASDSVVDEEDQPDSDGSTQDPKATANAKASDAKAPGEKKADPNKEVITITDDSGRKKLEIDYSDRAATRKAHEMAAGARKFQAERDREKAARTKLEEQNTADRRILDALEKAFAEKGEDGVIDLIAGKPGAAEAYIQRRIDRAKFLEKASPEEKAQLEQRERLDAQEREIAKLRAEGEAREKRVMSEREAAELAATEATVHPVFEKYRFDGKLGSEDDEAMFDEMLWNTALKRLKPYEEKGLPMTKELVDREFKAVSMQLRKRIGSQAEKKAAAIVEQKKQEATENAQASTQSAYKRNNSAVDKNDMLARGDFANFFRSFGNKRK